MLLESYVNIIDDKDEKERYFDEVWALLNKAYAKIGGVKGTNKDEMMQDNILWKLVRKGNKIVACQIYKLTNHGRKVVLGGARKDDVTGETDPVAKDAFYKIVDDDVKLTDRMAYAEVSDAMEHIYINKKGAQVIPAETVQKLLPHKQIQIQPDGYHYTRMIDGEPITKIMVGYPKGV